jgi:shikimate kinase
MLIALMINRKGIKLKKLWRTLFVIAIAVPQFVTLLLMQKILDTDGLDFFLELEAQTGSELECDHTVIATGGSMVLSESAMVHLKQMGKVVYIDVPFDEIERRVTNITTRGIAFHKDETLEKVYKNRVPLYERYADTAVRVSSKGNIEGTVSKLLEQLIFS